MARWVWVATVAVVLVACSKAGEREPAKDEPAPKSQPAEEPEADVVTAATSWEEPEPPAIVDGERALEVREPLRGMDAAGAPVFVARGDDARELVRRVFEDLDPHVPKERPVVIKINLGGYLTIRRGADNGLDGRITDPALVRALIEELRARGATDIAVADGASKAKDDLARALELSGYRAMLEELEVPFVDLSHYGEGDSRPAPWRMKLPWAEHIRDELVLSDALVNPERRVYLIDVPKMKTHRFAVMSLSIKNMMGAVMMASSGKQPPYKRRWRMHRELAPWHTAWRASRADDRESYNASLAIFSERLADLWGVVTPDLVILEGLPPMQGDGFKTVIPFGGGVVIASRNGCYADYVAAKLFGLHDSAELERELGARMPPAIAAVAERYYGGVRALASIEVRGDTGWRDARDSAGACFRAFPGFDVNPAGCIASK